MGRGEGGWKEDGWDMGSGLSGRNEECLWILHLAVKIRGTMSACLAFVFCAFKSYRHPFSLEQLAVATDKFPCELVENQFSSAQVSNSG